MFSDSPLFPLSSHSGELKVSGHLEVAV